MKIKSIKLLGTSGVDNRTHKYLVNDRYWAYLKTDNPIQNFVHDTKTDRRVNIEKELEILNSVCSYDVKHFKEIVEWWNSMPNHKLQTQKTYLHRNGFKYECIGYTENDEPIVRELHSAVDNLNEYWTFTVHGLEMSEQGEIDWLYSSDGHWE